LPEAAADLIPRAALGALEAGDLRVGAEAVAETDPRTDEDAGRHLIVPDAEFRQHRVIEERLDVEPEHVDPRSILDLETLRRPIGVAQRESEPEIVPLANSRREKAREGGGFAVLKVGERIVGVRAEAI